MASGSRIKAIEQAIAAAIAAQTNIAAAGVQVTRGHPGPDLLTRECVWVDYIKFPEFVAVMGGAQQRDQTITVTLYVRVSQEGNDGPTLRDRAYDLFDQVEEALRANPNLGGEALYGGVSSAETAVFPDDDGWVCAVKFEATYRARKG